LTRRHRPIAPRERRDARTPGTRQYAEVNVEVIRAELRDKPLLRQLLQLYQYDFSEFDNADVGDDGFYRYGYFDSYWTEPERHPLLFRVDGKWAGFALVRAGTPHDMAEFFVMRKYRRGGIGTAIAREVFARFPGEWQVRQMTSNPAATAFWVQAIPVEFEQDLLEHGPVQRFTIAH
jgi:predicted acetyltransferase